MAKKNNTKRINIDRGNGRTRTFTFAAPTAMNVQLVGDFTRWQEQPINMQKGPAGIWHTQVELSSGEHHYRFLVDGQWRDDPECTSLAPNPYGGQDAVCRVA